ncbi:non-canonical purine NTP pyrophosphatase [Corynebacterium terpenotabidum]|uniref:non-canonical purine NTP pyrophosphatase n=1 Tax=Corynebacterium terpenotabidum TaxID=89154 RepID=UPI0005A05DC9|nr:non-canonical purine NTP pyrophosphatase [Corynebacterium terpenotabidum]
MRVLVASRNVKKLRELERVLDAAGVVGIELLTLRDVPEYPETPETGATFEDNALIKARDGVRYAGLPTVADDSGLCVDALNGMPGVLSARWAGGKNSPVLSVHDDSDAANNALLMAQTAEVPEERRGAGFVSACALVLPTEMATALGLEEETTVRGTWRGTLLRSPRGDNGFGYDPLFTPEETPGRSSAELAPEEKDALSHRGRALAQLVPLLRRLATVGD